MPSLLLDDSIQTSPSVLMAIDLEPSRRPLSKAEVHFPPLAPLNSREPSESAPVPAVRIRPPSRPRSYIQILEDFNDHNSDGVASPVGTSPTTSRISHRTEETSFVLDDLDEAEEVEADADREADESVLAHNMSVVSSPEDLGVPVSLPASPRRAMRKEDTVRRRKRFSLPAVAIHTTPVTTRPNVVGEGKSKRWSLVLGNLKSNVGFGEAAPGMAAGKLSELLGRQRQAS